MPDCSIYVPSELFAPAESSSFKGCYTADKLVVGSDIYSFNNPITWEVSLTNTGEAFVVFGHAQGRATTQCARCLDEVHLVMYGAIEGYFIHREGFMPQDLEKDEFSFLPEDHCIDLQPLIETSLILEAPLMPLCSQECRGLCPTCGINLNHQTCCCLQAVVSHDSFHPFAVLQSLRTDKSS